MADLNISVLTVDDEGGLADFIQQTIIRAGYTAFMETDGLAAVKFFRENRPDIILIDVALGDNSINGIDVLKQIKEIDPNAVCIMATRITDEGTVKRAKELGALHYVLKPLKGADIVKIVNEAEQVIKQRRASNG